VGSLWRVYATHKLVQQLLRKALFQLELPIPKPNHQCHHKLLRILHHPPRTKKSK
jgi:hypothetical protein